jgi:glycosyltransferase involved in cell wall biosynthesis
LPLNILVLCHEFPPVGGGAAAVCAALSAEYVRVGHRVTLLTMGYGDLPSAETYAGIEVVRVACGRKRKEMASAWEALAWAKAAWPEVERRHAIRPFDITHAHFIMPAGIVARKLNRRYGVPYILTPHGSDVPGFNRERLQLAHLLARPWWKRIASAAAQIVSPSHSLLTLIQRSARLPHCIVIPNGFEPGRFLAGEKAKRILLCSRLVERKGFQYFLEAISELDLPGWEVDIVGTGPMLARLEALAAKCHTPVHFWGWLNNDDPRLAELYSRAMIFALPSEWENFSIALLEGMSAGCAVLTTDISGNPEAVGETGLLVPPQDISALRQAVLELTGDETRCRELGELAAQRAANQFSWQIVGQRYLQLLEQFAPLAVGGKLKPMRGIADSLDCEANRPAIESSADGAETARGSSTISSSNWSAVEVPIWIENPCEAVSQQQPLTLGLPLPQGRVFQTCHASLRASGEGTFAEQPTSRVQCSPLAFWPDGSIRWLLVDAIVPRVEAGKSLWQVCLAPNETHATASTASSLQVTASGAHTFFIESAGQAYRVAGQGAVPLQWNSKELAQKIEVHLLFTDSQGQRHIVQFQSAEIETEGAQRTTLMLRGTLPASIGLQCRLRLTFFAESGLVRASVTLHNPRRAHHTGGLWDLGDAGSVQFQSWVLKLSFDSISTPSDDYLVAWQAEPTADTPQTGQDILLYQDSSGGENWRSPVHMNRSGRVPCQFRGYRAMSGPATTTGLRANPTVAFRQGNLAVAASVPEFWQQFPLSLQANASGIEVGLFPSMWSDRFELQGGEQKTHTVWMEFHANLPAEPQALEQVVQRLSCLAHLPLRAACTPAWYASAAALPYLTPTNSVGEQSTCEQILSAALSGEQSLWAKRETIDEYGWRNYGDVWADHEQAYFPGSGLVVSHYNNQFDTIAGGLRQFMQSGDSAWWAFVAPLVRHAIDIDIYHTQQDRAAYNGGLFWFTDHYFSAATSTHRTYSRRNAPQIEETRERSDYGGGPGSEHNFATGLLYYYWMTGEPDAAVAVRTLADWVIAMDDGQQNFLGLLDDGPTGLATMSGSLEYQGPGRGAANSMQVLLDAWLLTNDQRYLSKCEAILQRVIHPADDIACLHLLDAEAHWSYTMFLSALVRYIELKAESGVIDRSQAYARESLLAYARWMAQHERPYLDHPEQLQFPTEAWAAQDLRKANVLRLAARYEADAVVAEQMRHRGETLADRAWSDLQAFSTRQTTRTVAIVMTEGAIDGYLRANRATSLPKASAAKYNFGKPEVFVPQKLRIRNKCRTPLGILQLVCAALRPTAWLRLVRVYNRQRLRREI